MKKLLVSFALGLFLLTSISAQTFSAPKKEKKKNLDFGKNNISLFLSDVVMKRISFEYEHIMGETGNMSINIPASVSIGTMTDVYDDEVNWWVGIGMKLYPTGQGTIRYFFGPEVRIIGAHVTNVFYNYYDNYTQETSQDLDLVHSAFLLNNGMIYEPTKNFIFTVSLGLGFISRDDKDPGFYPMATPSVRMGIRF